MTINIDTKKTIQLLIETHRIKCGYEDKYFFIKNYFMYLIFECKS